ncbi:hypothetical protein [Paenibacillus lautus]|uniref:hypothetical protein n=1 Tax=Paenibacillus lautus TaxID=1401 RepID=UPI000FD946F0|nr:hypothetical protein [Paenibacillus lautus]
MRNNGNCVSCGGEVYPASNRCAQCGMLQTSGPTKHRFMLQVASMIGAGLLIFAVPVILLMMWRH